MVVMMTMTMTVFCHRYKNIVQALMMLGQGTILTSMTSETTTAITKLVASTGKVMEKKDSHTLES